MTNTERLSICLDYHRIHRQLIELRAHIRGMDSFAVHARNLTNQLIFENAETVLELTHLKDKK